MKIGKYYLNEKGKKRILFVGCMLVFVVLFIGMSQLEKSNDSIVVSEYKSEELGKAILGSIDKREKFEEKERRIKENESLVQGEANTPANANFAGNPEIGDFFNNSAFIGDSRVQGLMIYSGVTATGYTEKGLDVKTAANKPVVFHNGTKLTIPNALSLGHKFDRIIIKLGINELGWRSTDVFKEQYGTFVSLIKAAQPEAKIYVHAILPVTAKKSADGSVYNNPRINEFNALIKAMASEQDVNYLDVSSALANEQGFLPEEGVAADGIHLTSDFCKKWLVSIKKAVEAS